MTRLLIRALLRLAPADFRRRYGEELLGVHDARAGGPGGRGLRFALRELWGTLKLVVRLRAGGPYPEGLRAGGSGSKHGTKMTPRTTTRRGSMLDGTIRNLRYALRGLRRHPGYAVTAVGILALGIGATTAIFSAANAFLFRPLPFAQEDRLAVLYETNPEFGWTHQYAAPANVLDWRESIDAFESVAMYDSFLDQALYLKDGEPVLLDYITATGNFFDVLGVRPALGRTFGPEHTWTGSGDPVVLSHDAWERTFGADPALVGRTVEIGEGRFEVVGIMPEGFTYPDDDVDIWLPYRWEPDFRQATWFRRAHWVRPVARLAAGATFQDADAQLQTVAARLQEDFPETNEVMGAGMMPLRDFLVRDVRGPLTMLGGAGLLLLLLACVNVANLALVRAGERRRELGLRRALGAGRASVVAQLSAESGVVAVLGGLLGLGLGWMGVEAVEGLMRLGIEGATGVTLDHRVILMTLAATLVSAVAFALAPLIRMLGQDPKAALQDAGPGRSRKPRSTVTAGTLVSVEVALALLLVLGAGLMVRTFWHLRVADPGFRTEGVLAFQVTAPVDRYPDRTSVLAFQDRLLELLEGRPGIEEAGLVAKLPLDGTNYSTQFQADGWPADRVGFEVVHRRADPGYFEALDIPLLRGRMFGPQDGPDGPRRVLVNESFAETHFPGEDPLGRRLAFDRQADSTSTWFEIIGVVGDQNQESISEPARPEVFRNRRQDWGRAVWIVARTRGEPTDEIETVRSVLSEVDPLIPIMSTTTLRDVWRESMARQEFILALLLAFGVCALLLATVGVYGVTSQAARRRTHEIGIRMALGAARRDVVRLMVRNGMVSVAVGLAAGSVLAFVFGEVMASVLYGVEADDAITVVSVVLLLAGTAFLASWIPARRATRVDPVDSLRAE